MSRQELIIKKAHKEPLSEIDSKLLLGLGLNQSFDINSNRAFMDLILNSRHLDIFNLIVNVWHSETIKQCQRNCRMNSSLRKNLNYIVIIPDDNQAYLSFIYHNYIKSIDNLSYEAFVEVVQVFENKNMVLIITHKGGLQYCDCLH